jgi:hypothetical protein
VVLATSDRCETHEAAVLVSNVASEIVNVLASADRLGIAFGSNCA